MSAGADVKVQMSPRERLSTAFHSTRGKSIVQLDPLMQRMSILEGALRGEEPVIGIPELREVMAKNYTEENLDYLMELQDLVPEREPIEKVTDRFVRDSGETPVNMSFKARTEITNMVDSGGHDLNAFEPSKREVLKLIITQNFFTDYLVSKLRTRNNRAYRINRLWKSSLVLLVVLGIAFPTTMLGWNRGYRGFLLPFIYLYFVLSYAAVTGT